MAKNKDDIKYGSSQARLSEDEAVRVAYKHGTPLEGGKIAESETIDMFSSARNISKPTHSSDSHNSQQQQQQRHTGEGEGEAREVSGSNTNFSTGAPRLPHEGPPPAMGHKF
ncbi:seed maturation protein [Senna tora]|uniref:Seed maturation protein n=1 Tax=Senna tora TaxID=362788 RepID=A0A834TJM1_9FABA|nr:seed maturation protein [Senna tora]